MDNLIVDKLNHRKRVGLSAVYRAIRMELMLLGLVSILLSIVSPSLTTACLPCTSTKDAFCSNEALAYYKKGKAPSDNCPLGQISFASEAVFHYIHFLIFLIAVMHILFGIVSMAVSFARLKYRWRSYEAAATLPVRAHYFSALPTLTRSTILTDGEMTDIMRADAANVQARTAKSRSARILTALFVPSLQQATYISLRRLVVEGLNITVPFDFLDYMSSFMEEEYAHSFHIGLPEITIAVVATLTPEWFDWVLLGLSFLFLALCVVKVVHITIILADASSFGTDGGSGHGQDDDGDGDGDDGGNFPTLLKVPTTTMKPPPNPSPSSPSPSPSVSDREPAVGSRSGRRPYSSLQEADPPTNIIPAGGRSTSRDISRRSSGVSWRWRGPNTHAHPVISPTPPRHTHTPLP